MRSEVSRGLPLVVLFAAGLAAGIWVFVSPWALGYPGSPAGWTPSTWTSVWAGGVMVAISAVSMVAVLARSLYLALRVGTGEA